MMKYKNNFCQFLLLRNINYAIIGPCENHIRHFSRSKQAESGQINQFLLYKEKYARYPGLNGALCGCKPGPGWAAAGVLLLRDCRLDPLLSKNSVRRTWSWCAAAHYSCTQRSTWFEAGGAGWGRQVCLQTCRWTHNKCTKRQLLQLEAYADTAPRPRVCLSAHRAGVGGSCLLWQS